MSLCSGLDAHTPTQNSFKKTGHRKYFMFQAAADGCLTCLRHLIEIEGIDWTLTSDSCKYSALDFAQWELSKVSRSGGDSQRWAEVIEYLESLVEVVEEVPHLTVDQSCNVCLTDLNDGTQDINAQLRQAVSAQCMNCAHQLLVKRADPLDEPRRIWGESALSLAISHHTRTYTMLQLLQPMRVAPSPPAQLTDGAMED